MTKETLEKKLDEVRKERRDIERELRIAREIERNGGVRVVGYDADYREASICVDDREAVGKMMVSAMRPIFVRQAALHAKQAALESELAAL